MTVDNHQSRTLHACNGLGHSISISGVAEFDADEHRDVVKDGEREADETVDALSFESSFANVASASRGARVLFATDEWFASADNLLNDSPPSFDPDEYCEQGKVMDGWESRRRREAGHDWCVIELTGRSKITAVELDTAYFTGNHVPVISLELADLSSGEATTMARAFPGIFERLLHGCVRGTSMSPTQVQQAEEACRSVPWQEILSPTPLRPGFEATRLHRFRLPSEVEGTHLRLNYFPDGGVARLRLWGHIVSEKPRPLPGPAYAPIRTGPLCTVVAHHSGNEDNVAGQLPSQKPHEHPELSLQEHGGVEVLCSNRHYGQPANLIQSNLGRDMGDGWETARHPNRPSILVKDPVTGLVDSPLFDWCVLKLGIVAGSGVSRIILDTKHFRGNYPESVEVQGCYIRDDYELDHEAVEWFPLIARCRMSPDSEHAFDKCKNQILNAHRPVSHVKVSIYPDGGLSRVRIYGAPGHPQ